MASHNEHDQPDPEYGDGNDRPRIGMYSNAPTFSVGDKVWLNESGDREGPYLVASPPANGKCALCGLDWATRVRNSEPIGVEHLEKVS